MFTTLISAAQLTQIIAQPKLVVVDCRHELTEANAGRHAYKAGHIQGAVFAHLDTELSGAKLSSACIFLGRHPLPDSANLVTHLRDYGISNDSQVIAYDAHGGMYASRLWWLLRSLGHEAVAVLDGGLPAWLALGNPLQTLTPPAHPGNFQSGAALTKQVDVGQVLANLSAQDDAKMQTVDARGAERFRGENENMDPVGGHIPGAINRFFKDNLQADGTFKPAAQLRQEWQTIIADPNKAIMSCGSGVTACHNLLALEVAGLSGAALYPGSWSEWCADKTRPIATGDA